MQMGNKIVHVSLLVAMGLILSACSSMSVDKVWPFGDKKEQNLPARLANATEFQCDGGKHFHVRYVDNGDAVWLIFPDREVLLTKSGTRYSNGVALFEVSGNEATLSDGPTIAYKGCKAVGK